MASPLTTLGAATIGATVSVTSPVTATVMSGQAQPQTPQEASATPTTPLPQKDNVEISSQARSLSQRLAGGPVSTTATNGPTPQVNQALTQKASGQVIIKPTDKPDLSFSKQYPPFIGDSSRLEQIKLTSPALYRQVLRMIVPPPVDLSYADMQYLKRSTAGSNIR